MKALVAIVVAALAGLNIYQFVKIQDFQTDAELMEMERQGELENAVEPLLAKNTKLTTKTESLENQVAELQQELSDAIAGGSKPASNDTTPIDTSGAEASEAPMKALAKMMENPQMKEMMVAQQKASLEMMYKGLFEKFGLEGEELEHFKKLLTDGQMELIESGMSLMNPDLSEEERKAIYDKIAKGREDLQGKVKEFLNDEDDFKEFEFYGSTLGERMTVSGVQGQLQAQNIAMDPAQEDSLIRLMHEEREKVPFENKYYDQNGYDPTTLTNESIDQFMTQYDVYQNNLNNRVGEVLSPEQAEVFKGQQKQASEMQKMGLKMAAGMFGGGK